MAAVEVAMTAEDSRFAGSDTLTLMFTKSWEADDEVFLTFWNKDEKTWNTYPLDEFLEALMAGAQEFKK
jgi:hypothetical protein